MADIVCSAYGIKHTQYHINFHESAVASGSCPSLRPDPFIFGYGSGRVVRVGGFAFSELSHSIKSLSHKYIHRKFLIPVIGGILVILITFMLGTRDYLGIGVVTPDGSGVSIVNAFKPGGADPFSWLWKLLLTSLTLSTGFKGAK
jgi:H+/Cl- antiporter ClcA